MPASETAAWLAGVIGEAAGLQVKVTQLPELLRRWTAQAPVRCLCVDGTEDGLASLAAELHAQWGFETQRFLAGAAGHRAARRAGRGAARGGHGGDDALPRARGGRGGAGDAARRWWCWTRTRSW